jgi:hypothetical protein
MSIGVHNDAVSATGEKTAIALRRFYQTQGSSFVCSTTRITTGNFRIFSRKRGFRAVQSVRMVIPATPLVKTRVSSKHHFSEGQCKFNKVGHFSCLDVGQASFIEPVTIVSANAESAPR